MYGHDPLWIRAFLAVHITAGGGAFVLAPLALLTAKGGKAHRRWGKIYFWCMTVVAITALIMALWRPVLFLAFVSVFSFYSAFVGYRILGQKAAWKGEKVATALDWSVAVIDFVCCAALATLGAVRPAVVQNLGIPAMVFGGIGIWIALNAVWGFTHPQKDKMFWWYGHLQGMLGSYIAAWTAFCIVTIGPLVHGAWWLWLLPTAIGVPAMIATTAYYQRKFAPKVRVVQGAV